MIVFLIFISFAHRGNSANILGLFGASSHSHQLWNNVIVNALAERGHILTIASVDYQNTSNPNVTHIHLEGAYSAVHDYYKNSKANYDMYGPYANIRLLHNLEMLECKAIYQSKGFKNVSNLNEKFDLILFDMSGGSCILRLFEKYPGIPSIGVSAYKMDPNILKNVGGHNYPGYISYYLNYQESSMNFCKRLTNFATYAFAYFYRKYITEAVIERLTHQYVPGPKPTLNDLYKRVKIALINTHPSIDYAQSLPPNIIEIGGLHIKEPQKLPEDIISFIESATRGVVLISLGSNVRVDTIGKERIEAFLNVIKSFPQYNFLWKMESENIVKNSPRNLFVSKWLPQNDILANPKTRAFLTHAGSLSMQEATWHGVPVIAMPLFLDQFTNAHNAHLKGYGFEVSFINLNNKSLMQAFSSVLNDNNYRNRMLELQKKFRERQNRPLDTGIWWIEYFIRHPNAEHFSLSSRNLSVFVTNSFDVIMVVLLAICVGFVIIIWILLNIFRTVCMQLKKQNLNVKELFKKIN